MMAREGVKFMPTAVCPAGESPALGSLRGSQERQRAAGLASFALGLQAPSGSSLGN